MKNFFFFFFLAAFSTVRSESSGHHYKDGDTVPLYANKVGPFHDPSETYRYFDLHFCLPERKCSSQDCGQLCGENECFSCNSYREANSQIVRGTLLIPCRTAMRGSFPLNGTYFQVNEVNLKPRVPTKAVCAEHLELRSEILTWLNLQKQVQYKEAEGSSFQVQLWFPCYRCHERKIIEANYSTET